MDQKIIHVKIQDLSDNPVDQEADIDLFVKLAYLRFPAQGLFHTAVVSWKDFLEMAETSSAMCDLFFRVMRADGNKETISPKDFKDKYNSLWINNDIIRNNNHSSSSSRAIPSNKKTTKPSNR